MYGKIEISMGDYTMKINRLNIGNIPSIIWGEKSNKVYIAVHGNMSNKENEVIKILAEKITSKDCQFSDKLYTGIIINM